MITMDEARRRLIESSPFLERAQQHSTEHWNSKETSINILSEFADVLVKEWAHIPDHAKRDILRTVETLLVLGDDTVQSAVTAGFLESLVNFIVGRTLRREVIEPLLGPESLVYCREWEHFSDNMSVNSPPKLANESRSPAEKAKERVAALERWLRENPTALSHDRVTAERLLKELRDKLGWNPSIIHMHEARILLAALSPALRCIDQEHTTEWGSEGLPTVLMGEFAQAFASEFKTMLPEVRQRILDTIEKLMVEGDELVQTAAATGFLESLLNSVIQGTVDRSLIESMLGPESMAYWKAWDQFSDNPYRYRYDELKEQGLLQSEQAEKYARYLEQWLEERWYPSKERTEVENVLRELRDVLESKVEKIK